MSTESPQPLTASIVLGLSATRLAPIAPVERRTQAQAHGPRDRTGLFPRAPFAHALVICEPGSDPRRARSLARELCSGLERLGVPADLHVSRCAGDACARLATLRPQTELVLCVGGIGLLAEVLHALPGPELPVGLLPTSADALAGGDHSLALPRSVDHTLERVAARSMRARPVIAFGGGVALTACRAGRTGRAAHERRRAHTRRSDPAALHVQIDGARLPGPWTEVEVRPEGPRSEHRELDARLRREHRELDARLRREHRELDARLRREHGELEVRLRRGHGARPLRAAGRRIAITSETPVPFQADGLPAGAVPVELRLDRYQTFLAP